MVGHLEEADVGRGGPELVGDLGLAVVEIREVDAADLARGLGTHRAHARFLVQFVE
jgi:hypothetical protein